MDVEDSDQRLRAADRLIAFFEKQILEGVLAAGAPMPPEREIVQAHGVSRTVVREAVLALSNKGLLSARPGYRPVVIKPGYDTAVNVVSSVAMQLLGQPGGVRNLFDLRIMMEVSLARQAAVEATSADIEQMEAALAANGAAIEDSETFYQTDIAFHGVLYAIPGNPLLTSIHRAYTDWLAPQWRQMPRMPGRNQTNFEAHSAVFDAILRRDADLAEAALRRHLAAAWSQVSETFGGL